MFFRGTKATGGEGQAIRVELKGCAKKSRTFLNVCSVGVEYRTLCVLRKLLAN